MGKKKRKRSTVKVEDYYNDGIFELARFGKFVSLRNNASPEQLARIMTYYKNEYPKVKERINQKVGKIRDEISHCNPWMLLKFAKDMAAMGQMNKFSEIEYTNETNMLMRAVEYIQSVLVSTENQFNERESDEAQEVRFHTVLADVENLYDEFVCFYNYWAAYTEDTHEIPRELMDNIVESQMLYLVRGNRYQIFQLEPLKKLLPPHNDILVDLFGVTTDQVIEGLYKLEYAMSQELGDAWMGMMEGYDEYCKLVQAGVAPEVAIRDKQDIIDPIMSKIFGDGLNNISLITGWDERLLNALSLGIGECRDFFDDSEFSGWPIVEMPTKRKPFISIDGVVYGFDYYSLFDNFYRALQKAIFHLRPEYVDTWSKRQNIASENMVMDLFLRLLPGAAAHRGNYYPAGSSTKKMNENDLIITYENFLFIVEVKAGSFPQTPPISDYKAHIKAYTKLAQEADSQCSRTVQYLVQKQVAPFYAEDQHKKFEINMAEFDEVYTFSVTIDNFNEFAAKAEKLNFITLSSKTIVISYDDLLAYEKYFDSPILFLHYLKQRKSAIDVPQIALNDELDHLGLYIKYNMYSITASEFSAKDRIQWHGFREDLDNYFCKLYIPEISIPKPTQDMPKEMSDIIDLLDQKIDKNTIALAHFLLDMSSEARDDFCGAIRRIISRQIEIGRTIAVFAPGEQKYCLFVDIPGISTMSIAERQDYVLSATLRDEIHPIMWIDLEYDRNGKLIKVGGKECWVKDIPSSDIERLKTMCDKYTKSRIESFQRQNHKKVGRNDPCPCGSGKKYKKCCLHNLDI